MNESRVRAEVLAAQEAWAVHVGCGGVFTHDGDPICRECGCLRSVADDMDLVAHGELFREAGELDAVALILRLLDEARSGADKLTDDDLGEVLDDEAMFRAAEQIIAFKRALLCTEDDGVDGVASEHFLLALAMLEAAARHMRIAAWSHQ